MLLFKMNGAITKVTGVIKAVFAIMRRVSVEEIEARR